MTESVDFGSYDFPWPSPDDELFGEGENSRAMADVQQAFWGSDSLLYAMGYRRGAEILVEYVLAHGMEQDYLVYPILFLYRQHVELKLKEIAVSLARLLEKDAPPERMMGRHELEPLWRYCRPLLVELEDGPVADLDNAERTLNEIARVDPGSYAFRYAKTKQGERALPEDLKRIYLDRVHRVMSGVSNLLDGITEQIHQYEEWRAEMAREWEP